jgi:histidine triad (HIT) family protein
VQSIPQKIHAGTEPGAIVARTADHIAFLDHEPIATGHTLVCPVRNVTSIFDLSDVERIQFLDFAESVDKRLRETLNPVGISQIMNDGPFNELNHLHLHLIPRYHGDGFSWSTPFCRPHTISELEQTAKKIRGEQDPS